jgi:cyclase
MMQHVMTMQRREIDELIILDIDATRDRRGPNYDAIESYTSQLYCPLTVGGGISKVEHIKNLLNAGADKVAIKSNWGLIREASEKIGLQSLVGVLDFKDLSTGYFINSHVAYLYPEPGEILLTHMDSEGMRQGYCLELLARMLERWKCPIIINGGCGCPDHMLQAIQAGAHAVAASSMFLFTETTPKDCARYLHNHGIPVRL